MKKILFLTALLVLLFVPYIEAEDSSQRVIISFKDEIDEALVIGLNGKVDKLYENVQAVVGELPTSAIKQLEKNKKILSIEEDIVFTLHSQTVDWGISRVEAPKAWESNFTGTGVNVAILDTGIAYHPDLNIAGGVSIVSNSFNDDNGHGTHVAGIIGAKNNQIGTVGVAPNVNLFAVKVLDENGTGFLSDVIAGIDWSISNNIDIINLSLGSPQDSQSLKQAVDKAYESGILIVAAAGNNGNPDGSGDTVEFPANYASVIGVSAVDINNKRGPFSATGPSVEVAAPGVNIYSTYLNGDYLTKDGTSMAAAYVTGVLALLKETYPGLTHLELRKVIQETAIDIGEVGKDSFYGYGLVQASSDKQTSDAIYQQAIDETNLSIRFQLYIQGYYYHPEDKRFEEGINKTAELILNVASEQQRQGDYQLAKEQYELILSSPVLANTIKNVTEYNRDYAMEEKRTPEQYYEFAIKQFHFTDRIQLFVEGYNIYSASERITGRFEEGLNISALSLLNWSIQRQNAGDFPIAINQYELILGTPYISLVIKQNAEYNHKTALFDHAMRQFHFTDRLSLSIEAYNKYPNDTRFIEAINRSAQAVLTWTVARHKEGDYQLALERYNHILFAPILSTNIENVTRYNRSYALQQKRTPELFYEYAISQFHFTDRIEYFVEGFSLYNIAERNNGQFQEGLNISAQSLLNWAIRVQTQGQFLTAIDRYEIILSTPNVSSTIKQETEKNHKIALYNNAMKQFHFTDRLSLSIEAYNKYPRDVRFIEAINTNAQTLLTWSLGRHKVGDYEVAIDRYQQILSAPALSNNIQKLASHNLNYAEQKKLTPELYFDFAISQFHFADRIARFTEGFHLYNQTEQKIGRFEEGLNDSAHMLLTWASNQHKQGNFSIAIERYNTIINTALVRNSIKETARHNLSLAQRGILLQDPKKIINGKVQNYTFVQMEKDINTLKAMYLNLMETRVIGKSLDGRNIYAIKLGHGSTEVFINAASHAREHMTTNVLMKMIDEYAYAYAKGQNYGGFNVRTVLDNTSIWFVPMWNPDGVTLVQQGPNAIKSSSLRQTAININGGSHNFTSWKANVRGVDINRQFPTLWNTIINNPGRPSPSNYKGPKPLSEPESLAVYNFVLSRNFMTGVAYHSSGEVIYTRRPGHVAQLASQKTGYQIINTSSSSSGGGFTDWFEEEFKRPGLTPEISPYVGPRPVPVANWDQIWNRNNSIGLIVAEEAFRNRTLKR